MGKGVRSRGFRSQTVDANNDTLALLLGSGDGKLQPLITYPTGKSPLGIAAQDLDGDGFADAVTVNYVSKSLSVLLGAANGSLTAGTEVFLDSTAEPEHVGIADLNEDSKADIVVASNTPLTGYGHVGVFLGSGNGTFQAPQPYDFPGALPGRMALADMNGDHHVDFLAIKGNNVAVLLNTSQ